MLCPVRYTELAVPIRRDEIPDRSSEAGPFTGDGHVKQVYLVRIADTHVLPMLGFLNSRVPDLFETPGDDRPGVATRGFADTPAPVDRLGRQAIVAAEISTRWPALLRRLAGRVSGRRGLEVLAEVCEDDVAWGRTLARLKLDPAADRRAAKNLRALLRSGDGRAAAERTARLL